jgi:hypothetical protein
VEIIMNSLKTMSAALVLSVAMGGAALAQSGSSIVDGTKDGQTRAGGIVPPTVRSGVAVNSNARMHVKQQRRHKVRVMR